MGCDPAVVQALELDPAKAYRGVSVHIGTAAAAQQMVDASEPGGVETAEVVAHCLDRWRTRASPAGDAAPSRLPVLSR